MAFLSMHPAHKLSKSDPMIKTDRAPSAMDVAVFLFVSSISLIVFWYAAALLPKPVDDIPWAAGTSEATILFSLSDRLLEITRLLIPILVINLITYVACKMMGVYPIRYLMVCAMASTLGGLALAQSPAGYQFVWDLIIYFHLKRQDAYLDLTLHALSSGLAISIVLSLLLRRLQAQ